MNFGLVVTDERQSQHVTDLMQAALAKDWNVRCFLTDNGVNLIRNEQFIKVADQQRVHLSVCEHSVERICPEVDLKALEDVVIVGGQYQNAELVRHCDKVLVF